MNPITSIPKSIQKTAGRAILFCLLFLCGAGLPSRSLAADFNVVAFYTGKEDKAHISFVHEANQWFPKMGEKHHFTYLATDQWTNLNTEFLSKYQVVLFLDTRPDKPDQ